jgi:flavin-dependent dehydrogenase
MSVINPLAAHDTDNDHIVDVVIVGGSIVGLVLACALQSSGLRIALIEAKTPQQSAERPRASLERISCRHLLNCSRKAVFCRSLRQKIRDDSPVCG